MYGIEMLVSYFLKVIYYFHLEKTKILIVCPQNFFCANPPERTTQSISIFH